MGAAGAASLRYENYFEVTLVCEKSLSDMVFFAGAIRYCQCLFSRGQMMKPRPGLFSLGVKFRRDTSSPGLLIYSYAGWWILYKGFMRKVSSRSKH